MIDHTISQPKILLITDNPPAAGELKAVLSCSPFSNSELTHCALGQDSLQCIDGHDTDLVILWIGRVDSVDNSLNLAIEQSRLFSLPTLLITAVEPASRPMQKLSELCTEHFLQSELTPNLLRCAIGYLNSNRQLNHALNESEIRYGAVLDAIAEGVVICDADGLIESINPVAEQIFNAGENDVLQQPLLHFVAEDFRQLVLDFFQQTNITADGHVPTLVKEVEGMRRDGQMFPMELLISGTQLSRRNVFTCIVRDITLNKMKEEELQLTATAFETHTAILITDTKGTILRVNPAFTQITGYTAEEAVGNNPKMLQSGHHDKEFYEKFWGSVHETGRWEGEIWNKRKNGEIYPEWQAITAVKNNNGEITHYVATFQDITERKQTQALVEHHAFYDALTNLPNRRLMLDRLNQELSSSRRHDKFGALLFLDLDHFKTLNDSMGHAVGDLLLQQMANRLSNHVRKEDTVARLGGDEFVVLLPGLGAKEKSASNTANNIAKKIHASITQPYQLEGHSFSFTPSIGITLFPFADENADDVLKHADAAMYKAKSKGRNTICFYKPSMQAEADKRLQLEKELRTAIEKNELVLYYQPQFNQGGELVGVEALLRWQHPRRGIVEPKDFIALAEEANLIQPMGVWVLETAVRQYVQWTHSGFFNGNEYIAVNVSPKQLQQDDFVGVIADLLIANDIPPRSLKLELTESVLMHDVHDVVEKMSQLKELGVSFSMDDFGTGFSSLSYLKSLPFDQIKIDKTFINDVSNDLNDAAIVETIIAMAEHLKLDVIAEGVETREEFEFLRRKGCNNYQGFYFSTPLQASSLEQSLHLLFPGNQNKKANTA